MIIRLLVLPLILVCLIVNVVPVYAVGKEDRKIQFVEKVKAGVSKLGTGESATIEVKLNDKRKLRGYITAIDKEKFVLTDVKNKATIAIPYVQVKKLKGYNLSTGEKLAIELGVTAGVILFILYILID